MPRDPESDPAPIDTAKEVCNGDVGRDSDNDRHPITDGPFDRRTVLEIGITGLASGLAGCPQSNQSQQSDNPQSDQTQQSDDPQSEIRSADDIERVAGQVIEALDLPLTVTVEREDIVSSENKERIATHLTENLSALVAPGTGQYYTLNLLEDIGLSIPGSDTSLEGEIGQLLIPESSEIFRTDWEPDSEKERYQPFTSFSVVTDGQFQLETVLSFPILGDWVQLRPNWGIPTHRKLARRSLELLGSHTAEETYMELTNWSLAKKRIRGESDSTGCEEPRFGLYCPGVVREDGYGSRNWGNYFRHFYDPDQPPNQKGLGFELYHPALAYMSDVENVDPQFQTPKGGYFFNALQWGYNTHKDGMHWLSAIDVYDYSARSKEIAYQIAAHVLHLLQDVHEPDHINRQSHPDINHKVSPDIVRDVFGEDVPGENRREIQTLGYEKYVDWVLSEDGGIHRGDSVTSIPTEGQPVEYDTLKAYFDESARESDIEEWPPFKAGYSSVSEKDRAMGLRYPTVEELQNVADPGGENLPEILDFGPSRLPETIASRLAVKIPMAPTIDPYNPGKYADAAERHVQLTQRSGAGFLEFYYQVVNLPPYVKQVEINGHRGKWVNDTWDQQLGSQTSSEFIEQWQGNRNPSLTSRTLQEDGDKEIAKLKGDCQESVEIEITITFGPTAEGKVGPFPKRIQQDSISVRATGPDTFEFAEEEFSQASSEVGGEAATWTGTATITEPGLYTLEIEATDAEVHFPNETHLQLDTDPATPAKQDRSRQTEFDTKPIEYESGVDTNHSFTIGKCEQAGQIIVGGQYPATGSETQTPRGPFTGSLVSGQWYPATKDSVVFGGKYIHDETGSGRGEEYSAIFNWSEDGIGVLAREYESHEPEFDELDRGEYNIDEGILRIKSPLFDEFDLEDVNAQGECVFKHGSAFLFRVSDGSPVALATPDNFSSIDEAHISGGANPIVAFTGSGPDWGGLFIQDGDSVKEVLDGGKPDFVEKESWSYDLLGITDDNQVVVSIHVNSSSNGIYIANQDGTFDDIVTDGDPAPDIDSTLETVGESALGTDGRIIFTATVDYGRTYDYFTTTVAGEQVVPLDGDTETLREILPHKFNGNLVQGQEFIGEDDDYNIHHYKLNGSTVTKQNTFSNVDHAKLAFDGMPFFTRTITIEGSSHPTLVRMEGQQ